VERKAEFGQLPSHQKAPEVRHPEAPSDRAKVYQESITKDWFDLPGLPGGFAAAQMTVLNVVKEEPGGYAFGMGEEKSSRKFS